MCVFCGCSRREHTHISAAPFLDHGDDGSQLHLQCEGGLPLRLHLYVLPHLPHHWVHTLIDTDRETETETEIRDRKVTPVQNSIRVVRLTSPAYT